MTIRLDHRLTPRDLLPGIARVFELSAAKIQSIEDSWDAIEAHKEVIRNVVELIIRDGIAAGEFEKVDPAETSQLLMRSLVAFVHPVLISQCLTDEEDVDAQAKASIRFSLRAITPRT